MCLFSGTLHECAEKGISYVVFFYNFADTFAITIVKP